MDTMFVLKKGVYGVYITIKGKQYKGMANIGYNPTVGLIDNLSLEVNILILIKIFMVKMWMWILCLG